MQHSKGRLSIWGKIIPRGGYIMAAASLSLTGVYDLVAGQYPDLNLPAMQDYLPWWDWKIWLIIVLVLLLFGTLEGTYRLFVELEKEVVQSGTTYQRRPKRLTDYLLITKLNRRMIREHGFADKEGIGQDFRDGVPLGDISYKPCLLCGRPRDKRGDYNAHNT